MFDRVVNVPMQARGNLDRDLFTGNTFGKLYVKH